MLVIPSMMVFGRTVQCGQAGSSRHVSKFDPGLGMKIDEQNIDTLLFMIHRNIIDTYLVR